MVVRCTGPFRWNLRSSICRHAPEVDCCTHETLTSGRDHMTGCILPTETIHSNLQQLHENDINIDIEGANCFQPPRKNVSFLAGTRLSFTSISLSGCGELLVPRVNTSTMQCRAFSGVAPSIWNSLSLQIHKELHAIVLLNTPTFIALVGLGKPLSRFLKMNELMSCAQSQY